MPPKKAGHSPAFFIDNFHIDSYNDNDFQFHYQVIQALFDMTPQTLNQEWLNCIRNSGYRLTQPRRAVVDILSQTDQALPAITIFDLARMNYPSIGLVSIYRTLEMLESLDLIQRVHQPDGCHAYIAAFTGHQHLLLCQDCGATFVFQGDNLDSLFSRVEQESGYQVSDHWLQLFGTCTKCQASN